MVRTHPSQLVAAVASCKQQTRISKTSFKKAYRNLKLSRKCERMPVLVWDFAFLFVWLNKHPCITNKMRIPFGQDYLHRLWINKGNKSKHPLLLIRNPHILHWPINTSKNKTTMIKQGSFLICSSCRKPKKAK